MARSQDILAVIRGIQTVVRAGIKEEEKELIRKWNNSSIRQLLNESKQTVDQTVKSGDISSTLSTTKDGVERVSTVFTGINQFLRYKAKETTSVGAKTK